MTAHTDAARRRRPSLRWPAMMTGWAAVSLIQAVDLHDWMVVVFSGLGIFAGLLGIAERWAER